MSHLRYLSYVLRHKWFVLAAAFEFKVPLWRALVHDLSKFLPDEWMPYAEYFYGAKRSREWFGLVTKYGCAELAPWGTTVGDRFNLAWLRHQHRNAHHWQFWILRMDDGETLFIPMPEVAVREMVADWRGAGLAQGESRTDLLAWYTERRDHTLLHPETRVFVDRLVGWTPRASAKEPA